MNKQIFKVVFDNTGVGLAFLGKDGEIIYCNRSLSEMFGRSFDELLATRIFEYIDPEFRRELEQQYRFLIEGTRGPFSMEVSYTSPELKTTRWLDLELTLEYDGESKVQFVFGTIRDITEQKEGKDRLIRDKEAAEKLTRTKSDFLANMSHEIRTPIHTIMGMNDLLLETNLDAEQQEYASQVSFSAEVLLCLINDILDVSKIEAGKLELETVDFDLFSVSEGAVDMVALEAHKKGLEVCLFIENDVPHLVQGDPVRLRQIIVNLFNNAVKFTSEGEISVRAEKLEEDEDSVLIKFSVRDTGIGISKEHVVNLFKAFTQADSSTTRKYGGTGLGLSISKSLSEMMGGGIGVESILHEGSTFWFSVRLGKQKRQYPQVEGLDQLKGTRIIIVDDNATARDLQQAYLEAQGCFVATCEDGQAALEMMAQAAEGKAPFDICLIDLLLPGMDGWHLASEINADKRINSSKLILLSPAGKSAGEAKMKLLRWFDAYLNKPIKKREYLDCLVRLVSSEVDLESVEDVEELEELKDEGNGNILPGTVLVAEDHEVNQQLFHTILVSLGHDVVVAANGIEACKAVEEKTFDVIFMDVQMPEMNGYEATKKIREMGVDTPIIAATASAIKGEQDKCFEVGMNDILLKPFKKKDVVPLLDKWMGKTITKADKQEDEKIPEESQDVPVFDYEAAIDTFLGKKDVVKRVVQAFIEKVEAQIPVMYQALEQKDFEKLRGEAHSIKGGAWNLEIRKLGDKAKDLEDSSRESREEDSRLYFEELQERFREFTEFVDLHSDFLISK